MRAGEKQNNPPMVLTLIGRFAPQMHPFFAYCLGRQTSEDRVEHGHLSLLSCRLK